MRRSHYTPVPLIDQSDEIKYANVESANISSNDALLSSDQTSESKYIPIVPADEDVAYVEFESDSQSWSEKLSDLMNGTSVAVAAVGVAAVVGVATLAASDEKNKEKEPMKPEEESDISRDSDNIVSPRNDFLTPILEVENVRHTDDRDSLVPSSNIGEDMRIDTSRSTTSSDTKTSRLSSSFVAGGGFVGAILTGDEETGPQILKRPTYSQFEPAADLTAFVPPPPTNYVVKYSYHAIRADELEMLPGDLVGIEHSFEDGWSRVQNMSQSRKRGLIPFGILVPIKVF